MTVFQLPITFENLAFLYEVFVKRLSFRLAGNLHPTSHPYVSGDGFRALAQHVYDQDQTFDPMQVKKSDIVFVSLERIDDYFSTLHKDIQHPYVLISHNGDVGITKARAKRCDAKILKWYSQNVLVQHPKIVPIPIGIENLRYYNHGIPSLYTIKNSTKQMKIAYGFSVSTNPTVRTTVLNILQHVKCAEGVPTRLNARQYAQWISSFGFVTSPPGNGEDCIRTWEAMYLGVIPIVQRSVLAESFQRLQLPIWIVDDWNELALHTQKSLKKKYSHIMKTADTRALFMSFWEDRINKAYGTQIKHS